MLRFAPSPTGDMHIGNLRVALFNYIVAQQKHEGLVVRIEDTDKERNIKGKDKEILEILEIFGIKYQEVIYQSKNFKFHSMMALDLLHNKKAFNCFCSPQTLELSREKAKKEKRPYRYDGACENLPAELTIDNQNPFVVRLKKPLHNIIINDLIKGKIEFTPDEIDSFIIMRQDKTPTYNFACGVDDMISDISLVIRGEDHVSNSPKQAAIREALGYTKEIQYAHLPIILNELGKKMSKRDNASSVKWMLEEGFLPSAIANYLILIGNAPPQEIFTLEEAVGWFDITKISKAPVRFDLDKLKFINREHLKLMDSKELSRYVGFADEDIGNIAKIYLDEAQTLKELRDKIGSIFDEKVIPDDFFKPAALIRESIKIAPHFETFDEFKNHIVNSTGLRGKNFFKPLRLLLTGSEHGPELSDLYPYLKNYIKEIVK